MPQLGYATEAHDGYLAMLLVNVLTLLKSATCMLLQCIHVGLGNKYSGQESEPELHLLMTPFGVSLLFLRSGGVEQSNHTSGPQ